MHLLDHSPPTKSILTRDEALKLYYEMSLIRKMESTAADLYKARHIRGFLHLYSGQVSSYISS